MVRKLELDIRFANGLFGHTNLDVLTARKGLSSDATELKCVAYPVNHGG